MVKVRQEPEEQQRKQKMKNRYKINRFLLTGFIALVLAFVIPSGAIADTKAPDSVTSAKQQVLNLGDIATKQPVGKRQVAMKFVLAMLGVAASSVVIFVLLSIYNKFMYGGNGAVQNETDNDFKTPTNLKDAINIFLKKTK